MAQKSKIAQLMRDEITIEDVIESKNFVNSMPREEFDRLMENYMEYRRKKITKEIMKLILILQLAKHSGSYSKIKEVVT